MRPDASSIFLAGPAPQQIRVGRRVTAGSRGGRRRSPVIVRRERQLEYRRWASVIAQDHELLRQLLARFDKAVDVRERACLLHLVMEFYEVHSRFERGWDSIAELEPQRLELDLLGGQIERLAPGTPAWDQAAAAWVIQLRTLLDREDLEYARRQEEGSAQLQIAAWSTELLEDRLSLIAEVREVIER